MNIPKKYKLFASTIEIKFNNEKMEDSELFGSHSYTTNIIHLCDEYNGKKLAEDRILDTFYHEKVHSILRAMMRDELNADEEFVEVFAKLLRQSDETAEY